jgi:hypothetical protein
MIAQSVPAQPEHGAAHQHRQQQAGGAQTEVVVVHRRRIVVAAQDAPAGEDQHSGQQEGRIAETIQKDIGDIGTDDAALVGDPDATTGVRPTGILGPERPQCQQQQQSDHPEHDEGRFLYTTAQVQVDDWFALPFTDCLRQDISSPACKKTHNAMNYSIFCMQSLSSVLASAGWSMAAPSTLRLETDQTGFGFSPWV